MSLPMIVDRMLTSQWGRNIIDIRRLINYHIIFFNNSAHPCLFQKAIFLYCRIIKEALHNLFLGIYFKSLR